MVLFVGSMEEGYVLVELFEKVDFTKKIDSVYSLADIIAERPYEHVIIDIAQFSDDIRTITDELFKLKLATNVDFILFAIGYSTSSELIVNLKLKGFKYFVTGTTLTSQKRSLEKAVDGKVDEEEIPNLVKTSTFVEEQIPFPKIEKRGNHVFAVCGCIERMGTTTQSIQLVKYFQYKGYTSCYFEMNHSGYVKALARTFDDDCITDDVVGKVSYKNVDLFYRQEELLKRKSDYEFCVLDFGQLDSDNKKISFLEKETSVLCCGSSPGEFEKTTAAIICTDMKADTKYVFSFTAPEDEKELLTLMETRGGNTMFAEYVPDAFFLSSKAIKKYDTLLKIDERSLDSEKPKSIFNVFMKRGKKDG